MPETTLYTIACEMLRETNPYDEDLSELTYTLKNIEVSLLGMIKNKLSLTGRTATSNSTNNFIEAYNAISEAMEDYLNGFHSSFYFRQQKKKEFRDWLKNIQKRYNLQRRDTPFEEDVGETDTCIAMIKALHSREGVSVDDCGGVKERNARQYLRKLCSDLYEGECENVRKKAEYVPFRIAGQEVQVDIRVKKRKGDRKKYYYTPNTLHPIILQENLLQVVVLLKSLCCGYRDMNSNISLHLAMDIWSQLSGYAQEKIEKTYTVNNQEFKRFINRIKRPCPNNDTSTFQTERDMLETENLSFEDTLSYLLKLRPERTATLSIDINGSIVCIEKAHIIDVTDTSFVCLDVANNEMTYDIDNIDDIVVD